MRSRWTRLLPIMIVAFLIAFMDRTNISFAIPTMGKDLGFSASELGFAAGALFLGYGFAQFAGGAVADRGYGKQLILFMMVLWGLAEMAQAYVTNLHQLVIVRIVLGVAEGGIFPTFMLFTKNWFAPAEQARANGLWQICYPLAAMISGPLAGFILRDGSWRDLFIIEGILPVVWAFVWVWGVADSPSKAKWLSNDDKNALLAHLESAALTASGAASSEETRRTYFQEIAQRPMLFFIVAIFFWNLGFLGFVIWLPSVIAMAGPVSSMSVGLLSAIPFLLAIAVMQWLARLADKAGTLNAIASWTVFLAGVGFIVGGWSGRSSLIVNVSLLSFAGALLYASQPLIWTVLSRMVSKTNAGLVIGTMNASGVLGGFSGSYLVGFVRNATGQFAAGLWLLGGCLTVASVLLCFARYSNSAERGGAS